MVEKENRAKCILKPITDIETLAIVSKILFKWHTGTKKYTTDIVEIVNIEVEKTGFN